MKFSHSLFLLTIAVLFTLSLAIKVSVKPVDVVYGHGTSLFEFTLTEWDLSSSVLLQNAEGNELNIVHHSELNYHLAPQPEDDAPCYLPGQEDFQIGYSTVGFNPTNGFIQLEVYFYPISADKATSIVMICPISIKDQTRPNGNDNFILFGQKDENDNDVLVSLGLPEKFVEPEITITSAEFVPLSRLNDNTKVSNTEYQTLIFKFTTNAVRNLLLGLSEVYERTDSEFIDIYCTTGSGKNTKVVARQYRASGTSRTFIFLSAPTQDEITCTTPVSQGFVPKVHPYSYLGIAHGTEQISARIAIENNDYPNLGVVSAFAADGCSTGCSRLDVEIQLNNVGSYLLQNSTAVFTFDGVDVSYVRLNETWRSQYSELESDYTLCVANGSPTHIVHLTSSRRGNSIYFTDFRFEDLSLVSSLKCTFFFDAAVLTTAGQSYSTLRATVNGNKVYNRFGSTNLRFDFAPRIAIEVRNHVVKHDAEKKYHVGTFEFHVFSRDNWRYRVERPVIQITHDQYAPFAIGDLKCQMSLPSSSKYSDITLISYLNGYGFAIPLDSDTRYLDHTFKCQILIDIKYYGLYDTRIYFQIDDVIDGSLSRTQASSSAVISQLVPDVVPPVVELADKWCFTVAVDQSKLTTPLNHPYLISLAKDAATAYNQELSGIHEVDVNTASYIYFAQYNPDAYDPFNVYKAGLTVLGNRGTQFEICFDALDGEKFFDDYSAHRFAVTSALKKTRPEIYNSLKALGYRVASHVKGFTSDKCGHVSSSPATNPTCALDGPCKVHADCAVGHCSTAGICTYTGEYAPSYNQSQFYNQYAHSLSASMAVTVSSMVIGVITLALALLA